MGVKKVKTPSDKKTGAKYDPNAYTVIHASSTRPCLQCGRNSVHKANTCK